MIRQEIWNRAKDNVIVNKVLHLYSLGTFTEQQALEEMVTGLLGELDFYKKELSEVQEYQRTSLVFPTPSEEQLNQFIEKWIKLAKGTNTENDNGNP